MSDSTGRTTVVVGASRGLGRRIAGAFAEAGAPVVAVARPGPCRDAGSGSSAQVPGRLPRPLLFPLFTQLPGKREILKGHLQDPA
jgi:hypothetical protein